MKTALYFSLFALAFLPALEATLREGVCFRSRYTPLANVCSRRKARNTLSARITSLWSSFSTLLALCYTSSGSQNASQPASTSFLLMLCSTFVRNILIKILCSADSLDSHQFRRAGSSCGFVDSVSSPPWELLRFLRSTGVGSATHLLD